MFYPKILVTKQPIIGDEEIKAINQIKVSPKALKSFLGKVRKRLYKERKVNSLDEETKKLLGINVSNNDSIREDTETEKEN